MDPRTPDRPRCACGCGRFLTASQSRYASRECAQAGFVERSQALRRMGRRLIVKPVGSISEAAARR